MNTIQAAVMAIVQGATELFPVSSLGHAVILPALLRWPIDQNAPEFLPFLVMLHLGTAAALLAYFWKDWWSLATGVIGIASGHQVAESRRVFFLIVIATIPAVIIGNAGLGAGLRTAIWYAALTLGVVAIALAGRGVNRRSGLLIIYAYAVFVITVVITAIQGA